MTYEEYMKLPKSVLAHMLEQRDELRRLKYEDDFNDDFNE